MENENALKHVVTFGLLKQKQACCRAEKTNFSHKKGHYFFA